MKRTPLARRPKGRPSAALRDLQEAFGALSLARDAECANCGHRGSGLEVHHTLPRQALRARRLPEWSTELGLVLCDEPAPNRCHTRHTLAVARVPFERLRPENIEIAERYGLLWLLEKNHPRGSTE